MWSLFRRKSPFAGFLFTASGLFLWHQRKRGLNAAPTEAFRSKKTAEGSSGQNKSILNANFGRERELLMDRLAGIEEEQAALRFIFRRKAGAEKRFASEGSRAAERLHFRERRAQPFPGGTWERKEIGKRFDHEPEPVRERIQSVFQPHPQRSAGKLRGNIDRIFREGGGKRLRDERSGADRKMRGRLRIQIENTAGKFRGRKRALWDEHQLTGDRPGGIDLPGDGECGGLLCGFLWKVINDQ